MSFCFTSGEIVCCSGTCPCEVMKEESVEKCTTSCFEDQGSQPVLRVGGFGQVWR